MLQSFLLFGVYIKEDSLFSSGPIKTSSFCYGWPDGIWSEIHRSCLVTTPAWGYSRSCHGVGEDKIKFSHCVLHTSVAALSKKTFNKSPVHTHFSQNENKRNSSCLLNLWTSWFGMFCRSSLQILSASVSYFHVSPEMFDRVQFRPQGPSHLSLKRCLSCV